MRRARMFLLLGLLLGASVIAGQASANPLDEPQEYRIESASATLSDTQAGAHADFTTVFELSEQEGYPYALTRDIIVALPPGLVGNPEAFPKCTTLQLGTEPSNSECPMDSQVGSTDITLGGAAAGTLLNEPIYNMPAPGGDVAARFGFYAGPYPVILNVRLDPESQSLTASVEGASAAAAFIGASTTFWGVPANPIHDLERITPEEVLKENGPTGGRQSTLPKTPFMTNPTSCGEERQVTITATSYQLPKSPSSITVPFPRITGCGLVGFGPKVTLAPTTEQATTGSGLDYTLDLPTKGLEFPNLFYDSEVKRAEVTLPEGMTVNPSQAEGLGVCSEASLAKEAYDSLPNVGCPETSKIGTVTATTPVLDLPAQGSLYLAKPYENPFDSLLALYMVLKVPERGVLVKLAGEVNTDPETGQITTVFDDLPQLPVASFKLHFREGARAPLVTPPACGTHEIASRFAPHSAPAKEVLRKSTFQITSGVDHAPCPPGGVAPFRPAFEAGSINNNAGAYSPFNMRLTRRDGEQDMTKFSSVLPPGVVGKIAGVSKCPEADIAKAKARTGAHGAAEELADPSCPAASKIGRTLAGAGVGSQLTYVPGSLYLAGPVAGDPLSVVAITPGKAGPFDVGTIVVREALTLNPVTTEVEVDGSHSDPIPHILKGIPLNVRDIRVYADKPNFTINPTDCEESSARATLFGGFLDVFSPADDVPVGLSARYQAANCASLGFKPRLAIKLKGGTKRGGHPALRAVVTPRPGDANFSSAVVTLPHSAFLDQAHIRTICTRVQFEANGGNGAGCPAGAVYGQATATSPLLDEALSGPVYLRSSSHNLPDLVIALHGIVDINLASRIDSQKGGIRSSFEAIPDAPVSKFVLEMQGGKKGLIVNSTNLCKSTNRAKARLSGQNGKVDKIKPLLRAECKKKAKKKHRRHGR